MIEQSKTFPSINSGQALSGVEGSKFENVKSVGDSGERAGAGGLHH
jgi:hypothetical protein